MSHPNLSDVVNKAIEAAEKAVSVDLKSLHNGDKVFVQTHNTLYTLTSLAANGANGFLIEGNRQYCPTPVKAWVPGATFGGSMLKINTLFEGGYMEFHPQEGPYRDVQITTSVIKYLSTRKAPK